MKRLVIAFTLLLFALGAGLANYDINMTPESQKAISGSVVSFTVSAKNSTNTGAFVIRKLPHQFKYKSANILPTNNPALALGLEVVPRWSLPALGTLTVTINADVITQSFPTLDVFADVVSNSDSILTSAIAKIEPVADLFVEKKMLSHLHDYATYEVTLKNIGSAIATGVELVDIWPGEALEFSNRALINGEYKIPAIYNSLADHYLFDIADLTPGSTVVLQMSGTKKPNLPIGQQFTNQVNVFTKSLQYSTGNDSAFVTSSFASNMLVTMTVANLTDSTRNSLSGATVLAVSGDVLELRITLTNTGNLSNTGYLSLNDITKIVDEGKQTNWIQFLNPGESKLIVFTGIVGPKNFIKFYPKINLTYDSVNKNAIVTVSEQLICGDGLITQNEECDINNPNTHLLPGQVCVKENEVCVLHTEGILNQVYLDYVIDFGTGGTGREYDDAIVEYEEEILTGEAMCNTLTSSSTMVIVNENNQGTMQFTCSSQGNLVANEIKIDCGNGNVAKKLGTSSFTHECKYTYNANNESDNDYSVTCYVDDHTRNECKSTVRVKEGYYGICGDGHLDDGEDCDLGANIGNKIKIGTYLDLTKNYLAGTYGDGNYYCQNCRIRQYQTNEFVYQPPQCLDTNTTISVMSDELLPFWRRLRNRQNQFVESNYNCSNISETTNITTIDKSSMKCTFKVYDGKNHQQIDDRPLGSFVGDCYEWDNSKYFDYFANAYKVNFSKVAGRYVKQLTSIVGSNIDSYGEYKLVLDHIAYNYCDPNSKAWKQGRTYQGVCEVDFALTRPYVMQISTLGVDPIATTASDFLKDFYDMKGNSLIKSTDIDETINVDSSSYGFNDDVLKQMQEFKKKYEALSIAVDKNFKVRGNTTIGNLFNNGAVKKVPNQMIFFVKGDGRLTLKQLTEYFPGTPFTIYVEGMDVLIEGSVKTNGMIITDKKILFEDSSCEEGGQIVHGIFVSKGGFDVGKKIRNTNKNESRCPWGNLHVKGVLIGKGIENLRDGRRSHLNEWFNTKGSTEAILKKERKNAIFVGSSLLIEYNPSLWSLLPPGADSFTKTLEIYKK